MVLERRLTSRRQMSSCTAWFEAVFLCRIVESTALLSLFRPADGDGVSPGKGGLRGLVDALGSHEQGVDRPEASTLMSRAHSWGSRCAKAMCSHPGDFVRAQCREWWRRLQCRQCPVDALDSHEQGVARSTLK